ncbi:outer membrane protein assembly factor BamD [soil metagenome]
MTRSNGLFRLTLLLALVVAVPGCKTVGGWFGKNKEAKTETLPVETLYKSANDNLRDGDYGDAQREYTRLIARFPFGPYSEQSQLDLAYVQYKLGKPDDATSSIDRFIRTYPRHPHIDYAYYLKAVINFDRNVTLLGRLARLDAAERDLNGPMTSMNDFNEVIRRYPNSIYAQDARQRMVYLRNELARHELSVGLYYFHRGAWVSALNRGQYLIETYPRSEYQGDAVALMAASYDKLGQKTLAADSRRVLQQNYPQHPYLSGKWPKSRALWRQLNPFAGDLK